MPRPPRVAARPVMTAARGRCAAGQFYKMNPMVQTNAPMTIFGYPSVKIRGFDHSASIIAGVRQGPYAYLDAAFKTGAIGHKLTFGGAWDTYREDKHVNSYVDATASDGSPYVTPVGLSTQELLHLPSPVFSTDFGPRDKASQSSNQNLVLGDDISLESLESGGVVPDDPVLYTNSGAPARSSKRSSAGSTRSAPSSASRRTCC